MTSIILAHSLTHEHYYYSSAEHAKTQTTEGRLITSLPEDLFALAGVQLRTIRDRLTKNSAVLVDACAMVFSSMETKQKFCRDEFLTDLETSCAASNDFVRMADQAEEIVSEILSTTELSLRDQDTLNQVTNKLVIMYTNDAVFAAQGVHRYIFEPLEEELGEGLFSPEWEEMTHNEMAMTIVRTIEDYMSDIEEWMEELMVRKVVDGLVKASINFYIKHLLLKAARKGKKDSCFIDNSRALKRITGDITVIRGYFEGLCETFPALARVVSAEFEIIKAIYGLLYIAADDGDDAEAFFPQLQKFVRNVNMVRFMVGDMYHLVSSKKEREIYELFEQHEKHLLEIEKQQTTYVDEQYNDEGLNLQTVVIHAIGQNKRSRPMKGETMKSMENALGRWGWGGGNKGNEEEGHEEEGHEE